MNTNEVLLSLGVLVVFVSFLFMHHLGFKNQNELREILSNYIKRLKLHSVIFKDIFARQKDEIYNRESDIVITSKFFFDSRRNNTDVSFLDELMADTSVLNDKELGGNSKENILKIMKFLEKEFIDKELFDYRLVKKPEQYFSKRSKVSSMEEVISKVLCRIPNDSRDITTYLFDREFTLRLFYAELSLTMTSVEIKDPSKMMPIMQSHYLDEVDHCIENYNIFPDPLMLANHCGIQERNLSNDQYRKMVHTIVNRAATDNVKIPLGYIHAADPEFLKDYTFI